MYESLNFLASMGANTTGWLIAHAKETSVRQGGLIAQENVALGALIFIVNGTFEVSVDKGRRAIRMLGPGALVGEISFIDRASASATVVALEDARILIVLRSELLDHAKEDAYFAADLYRGISTVLAHRLRDQPESSSANDARDLTGFPDVQLLRREIDSFKEILHAHEANASHEPIAQGDYFAIQYQLNALLLNLQSLMTNMAGSTQGSHLQAYVRREFYPYVHLTEVAKRVLVKPRGYAGDYKTIQMIYDSIPGGVPPLGPILDRLLLDIPACNAVRNRRGLLLAQINAAAAQGGGQARVTSLACGPAEEIFDAFAAEPPSRLDATLIDIDFEALAHVAQRRDRLGLTKQIRLEHANLVYLATGRRALDLRNQDLIYSIGLIDYFEDKFVVELLNWIHECLAPGGTVILGNFHTDNPYRAFMDVIMDWKLIHRSEDDMHRLFRSSHFGRDCTDIQFEPERINMFGFCTKAGQ